MSFWDDTPNDTVTVTTCEKLQFVLRQFTTLTEQCRINTLDLHQVLGQYRELVHLNLSDKNIGSQVREDSRSVVTEPRAGSLQS